MNRTKFTKPCREAAIFKSALLVIALWLGGCGNPDLSPVELAPEDMCAHCRMAISEKRYAAEFIDRDGDAFKFDDIGCLVSYIRARQSRDDIAVYYFNDFNSQQWVRGEEAYFVSSPEFKTPMSGGIVAFRDKSKSEDAVARFSGRLMSFNDVIQIGGVTLSGSLRMRFESWDWFETDAANNDYNFGAATLRLSLGQQRERLDWQVEGEFPALFNLPGDATAPAPQGQLGLGAAYFAASGRQDAGAFIKQAFIRFKEIGGDKSASLRIGRFEFGDGGETTPADPSLAAIKRDHIAQRLIGPFGFSHVGRSFDGLHFARSTKSENVTFVAARPTEGVFQLRGWKQLDVDFYYGAYTRPIRTKSSESDLRVFALHYHDGRGAVKTDNRPQAARAADNENIRISHNTFFQTLPTPRVFARFPFFNLMNNEDSFVQLR
jgi:nitrous oxide reductase accessory protein NosL